MQALLRLAVLGAALVPSFARAATVSVHASVDWSQFAIVATDIGSGLPSVSFVSREDESTAAASAFTGSGPLSDQRSDDASDWTSGTLALAGLSQAGGSAQTGAELLANVSMGTPAYALQQVIVEARRGGSFVVSGTGMLTFRVPFAVSFQLDTVDSSGGAALAMAGLSVRGFGQGDETVDQTQVFALQENLSGPFTINRSQSGELLVSGLFTDGFSGTLNAWATSSAYLSAVPLPAPLGLLLSGLIGLAAVRRRQRPLRLEPPEVFTPSPSGGRVG